QRGKFRLYQDTLRVKEYFLFDPLGDYLAPPLQGYRLRQGEYRPIRPVAGRLASQVLGLHLEPNGQVLRLYDPTTGRWLPTLQERIAGADAAGLRWADVQRQAEEARRMKEEAGRLMEEARQLLEEARRQGEAENER